MNEGRSGEEIPTNPTQDSIQEILHKVIIAHQQALSLLQQTEAAYGRLVPHQLLNLLEAKSIVDVKLGDQVERKMTIMFSDIRDFTPLSESMTPSENFEFINSYLSQMEPVISRHRGIIDKYIGDTIMALFEHGADDAVSGAIAMLERLAYYNAGRERAGYAPVNIGIGLNTGVVMIGTVGGINRMDSTVIGDAVNLTARLEEATKTYHAPLIISQNTLYDLADPKKYDIRFLDRIRVKGKSQPLSIYEIFDNDPEELRNSKRDTLAMFEKAVAYYHLKDVAKSIPLLKQCIDISPNDYPALIYLERCYEFQATGQHFGTGELQNGLMWKEEHTGLAKVDDAHRLLMERINILTARIDQNECGDFADIFPFLTQHAQHLFPIEEKLMREHNYPFAEGHAQEHKRFIENFTELEKKAGNHMEDPRYLAFRTELLLLDWFASHATKADRHFARSLLTNKPK
ncbi:hemerythrin domain-containing protein [Sideroxydans lithotrophicus]|uniref:Adenylate/guanylate cyclase n=1 Tax=Sideroxydans lithotrophicus (strain ES-1) TaxID=580332 RepID=D5CTY7_SIDLE|nr:adenylate/guanylate cyclase domain-containing protein [Sideroxydans lithotrophicus]ADE12299.1 adenylate/guanylate cyclase [Sideroxydans lithotrophicus ES-1]